jgi:hypothetical protein
MGLGIWGRSDGLENSSTSDDLVPSLAQVNLLGRRPGPLGFRWGGSWHVAVIVRPRSGVCLASAAYTTFDLIQPP